MTRRRVSFTGPSAPSAPSATELEAAFASIRAEFDVPGEFPAEVLAAAEAAARQVALPERDETAVPFCTIDPPGSMDLDQALALERDGSGYRVRYAIADVPAFVAMSSPIDAEARRRVETIYLPDGRAPLHPPVLSEAGASLLPDQLRPAYVWDLRLDATGETTSAQVYRARVRSRERLDYEGVQRSVDDGSAPESLQLLAEVGRLRLELERRRGGASLPMPEQDVHVTEDGDYAISFRPPVPVEEYNAQISLLTGMTAASMMLEGQVGILRTMPAPDAGALEQLRRRAVALGVDWAPDLPHGEFLRGLDRSMPSHLALIHDATALFRGAGYTPFSGAVPEQTHHAAVAAPYAHVTAPLRRLVDRFGLLVCGALSAGEAVPQEVRDVLPLLPDLMVAGGRRAAAVDRACADAVEAASLAGRIGEEFDAVVVDERGKEGCVVQILEPAVVAPCDGALEPGTPLRVRLREADVVSRRVRFERA